MKRRPSDKVEAQGLQVTHNYSGSGGTKSVLRKARRLSGMRGTVGPPDETAAKVKRTELEVVRSSGYDY